MSDDIHDEKVEAAPDLEIARPNTDTWFDTQTEEDWTMKDGQPLRGTKKIALFKVQVCLISSISCWSHNFSVVGGFKHGHCFLYHLLKQYTKRDDIVAQ